MGKHVENHWKSYFGGKLLRDVTRGDLRNFANYLSDKGLAAKTKNNILLAGTVALNWAHENQLITANPAAGLKKFSGETSRRDILTDAEVKKLFAREWSDRRAKLGNMLAATTGLRVGELVALQTQDIDENVLHIRHSWSEQDRLKTTKTNKDRTVPILAFLRKELLKLASENPHGPSPTSFVFWSTVRDDTPCDRKLFTDHLREHLKAMKIDSDRGIVFHSWRHYYSARMADHLDKRSVMSATGHTSESVFDVYANHENAKVLRKVGKTTERVFSKIITEEEKAS